MKGETNKIYKLAIYTDFDGTITNVDIGDELFKVFGEFEPHHSKLVVGDISIEEYWRTVCSTLKPGLTKEDVADFADKFEIDPYFSTFANYCINENIKLTVVSDGYDTYIEPILKRIKQENLKVFCNKLIFNGNSLPMPVFPLASESCNCLCASCKRNAILTNVSADEVIAFIGDGYSDYCAAEHADIIFAKGQLAAYCNKNRLPHYPFTTFFDILKILKSILPNKKYRIRNQARLLRKKAFEIE